MNYYGHWRTPNNDEYIADIDGDIMYLTFGDGKWTPLDRTFGHVFITDVESSEMEFIYALTESEMLLEIL